MIRSSYRYLSCFALFFLFLLIGCYCFSMAGRDIRDICLQAERSWASKVWRIKISISSLLYSIHLYHLNDSICSYLFMVWQIIRGQVSKDEEQTNLPPLQEYIACATHRQDSLLSAAANRKPRRSSRNKIINE